MARAPALQTVGGGFDHLTVHKVIGLALNVVARKCKQGYSLNGKAPVSKTEVELFSCVFESRYPCKIVYRSNG